MAHIGSKLGSEWKLCEWPRTSCYVISEQLKVFELLTNSFLPFGPFVGCAMPTGNCHFAYVVLLCYTTTGLVVCPLWTQDKKKNYKISENIYIQFLIIKILL